MITLCNHELCWICQSRLKAKEREQRRRELLQVEQSPAARAEVEERSARLEAAGIYGASDSSVAKRILDKIWERT